MNNVYRNTVDHTSFRGIELLLGSKFNTISGNNINHGGISGIQVSGSNYKIVKENRADHNSVAGIALIGSENNVISKNNASNNAWGIYLYICYNNTILGNNLKGNRECIKEEETKDNIFENNDCGTKDQLIPGYNLIFLIYIGSYITIIIFKSLKLESKLSIS